MQDRWESSMGEPLLRPEAATGRWEDTSSADQGQHSILWPWHCQWAQRPNGRRFQYSNLLCSDKSKGYKARVSCRQLSRHLRTIHFSGLLFLFFSLPFINFLPHLTVLCSVFKPLEPWLTGWLTGVTYSRPIEQPVGCLQELYPTPMCPSIAITT